MAQTYTRLINLYINGTEVRNEITAVRAEMNKVINAQAEKIKSLRAILDKHKEDIGQVEKKWSMREMHHKTGSNFKSLTI